MIELNLLDNRLILANVIGETLKIIKNEEEILIEINNLEKNNNCINICCLKNTDIYFYLRLFFCNLVLLSYNKKRNQNYIKFGHSKNIVINNRKAILRFENNDVNFEFKIAFIDECAQYDNKFIISRKELPELYQLFTEFINAFDLVSFSKTIDLIKLESKDNYQLQKKIF